MNLLFLYTAPINPYSGGVERVTFTLANFFESKGLEVFFLGMSSFGHTTDARQFYLPDRSSIVSQINIDFLRNLISEKSINVVINQGGTSPELSELAKSFKNGETKLISVIHNSLMATVKNFSSVYEFKCDIIFIRWLLPLTKMKAFNFFLKELYKLKYSKHYKLLCDNSNLVVLLSEQYKDELTFLIDGKHIDNVLSIANPLSFDDVKHMNKRKEILYVGRINTSQKRIDLLLRIWKLLDGSSDDWTLNVVGDGEELESIKLLSNQLNLRNVIFHGACDPKPFYESASILCLTSSFEGFPMTLIESMQHGVVPVAFNSFLAITDIIDDEINGCIITPFDINEYVYKLARLMTDDNELKMKSVEARLKAGNFNLLTIGEQWIKILNDF